MNNELIHYLNSGVKVKYKWIEDNEDIYKSLDAIYVILNSPLVDITPYLYPLSCLTELIPIDGEMKIPLLELAKICEDCLIKDDYEIETNNQEYKLKFSNLFGGDCEFTFNYKYFSFYLTDNDGEFTFDLPFNQLTLFQKMFEWKINLFPDKIKSIDPRELGDGNPYKI